MLKQLRHAAILRPDEFRIARKRLLAQGPRSLTAFISSDHVRLQNGSGFSAGCPFLEASKQTKPSPKKQATALVKRLAALYAPPSMRIQVASLHYNISQSHTK